MIIVCADSENEKGQFSLGEFKLMNEVTWLYTCYLHCVLHFPTVDTPEAAVVFCTWLNDARQQGRFTSVHRGLRSLGKDRKSVQSCKHVYYMHKQDEVWYREVSKVTSHDVLLLNTHGCVYIIYIYIYIYIYILLYSVGANGVVAERSLYLSWMLCTGGKWILTYWR